jgi:hypothetical protein
MASPVFRDRLMKLQGRSLAMKFHAMRMLTCSLKDESPGVAGLITKLRNCQLNFDISALAIDVMGELGALYDHTQYERDRGYWQSHSFFSLGLIIGGGTAQIQKNIISEPEDSGKEKERRWISASRKINSCWMKPCAVFLAIKFPSIACENSAMKTVPTIAASGSRSPSWG